MSDIEIKRHRSIQGMVERPITDDDYVPFYDKATGQEGRSTLESLLTAGGVSGASGTITVITALQQDTAV